MLGLGWVGVGVRAHCPDGDDPRGPSADSVEELSSDCLDEGET